MTAKDCTIIFDFDGTLVDSFGLALKISNALAPVFGFRMVEEHEVSQFRTLSLREIMRRLEIPAPMLPLVLARGRTEMMKDITSVHLFEGIPALLERIKAQGLRMGIVTSNTRRTVLQSLRHHRVDALFDFVHSATNLFGKHRVLSRVLKKQHLQHHHIIYVGDEVRDVEASRRCRIPVAAVTWGFQSRCQLQTAGPDFLADTPEELATYIADCAAALP
ncbi:MAG: HAD-IA family hydrolase [Proteobacteria bacterium]|jgi:phosphoglycolate phosphatase-like HAD superfamily hydrolase|nr:HAD-IA family hydrolase [Pseudomonadota bacterium]NLN61783.1 HAD-IA family hydrolase [Myxococcales bacterium]